MFTRDNIRLLMSLRLRRMRRRRSCGSQGRVVRRNDLAAPGRERNSEKARERSSEREPPTLFQPKLYACLVIDVVPEVIVQHVLFGLKSLEGLSVQTYV